jgi:hypothetical protein
MDRREFTGVSASTAAAMSLAGPKEILAALPEIVAEYTALFKNAAKDLTDSRQVAAAREQIRRLLKDGTIVLTPSADHSQFKVEVEFEDLGAYTLQLAGMKRNPRQDKLQRVDSAMIISCGSGAWVCDIRGWLFCPAQRAHEVGRRQ